MKTELLRMLSPDAIEIGKVGGGWASLRPEDVAAALAGLDTGPYYLAMSVYVADPCAYTQLCIYIGGMRRVPRTDIEKLGADPVKGIIDVCLDELWGDNKCDTCGGTGNTHEQQQCPTCKGSKYKKQSDLTRSKKAGIPVEYWQRYKGFYDRLYAQFGDWDCQIRTHLAKRLAL